MPQAQVVLCNGIDFHTAKRAARRRNHAAKGSSVKFSVFRPYFDTLERMARIGILPYVQEYRDRQGKARRYFRRPGYKRVPLPGTPGAPQFMAAYQAALAAERPPIGRRHHWQFMGWMDELSWRGSSSKRPRQGIELPKAISLCFRLTSG